GDLIASLPIHKEVRAKGRGPHELPLRIAQRAEHVAALGVQDAGYFERRSSLFRKKLVGVPLSVLSPHGPLLERIVRRSSARSFALARIRHIAYSHHPVHHFTIFHATKET